MCYLFDEQYTKFPGEVISRIFLSAHSQLLVKGERRQLSAAAHHMLLLEANNSTCHSLDYSGSVVPPPPIYAFQYIN